MMLGTLILSAMSLLSAFVGLGHGYVRTIGLTDGLSSQAVYALHQDTQGYMWAGTYEGLNRLDGRHVKVYRAGPDGHDRISGDIVERVHETLPGVLWIHSNFGLDCLDTRTGRIAYHPALNGSYRSPPPPTAPCWPPMPTAAACITTTAGGSLCLRPCPACASTASGASR